MSSISDRWVAAGAVLAKNPEARVACPNCGWEYLEVSDIAYQRDPSMFARYLRCRRCDSVEILDRLRVGTNTRSS
jgi:hypothetical protein